MKRIDLSFTNHDTTGLLLQKPVDAVQRVTFTAPQRFQGKLRVPRLKISGGAFPLCEIKASSRPFTAAERATWDGRGFTPTDIIYGYSWSSNLTQVSATPSYYIVPGTTPEVRPVINSTVQQGFNPGHLCACQVLFNEKPIWTQDGANFYLKNPGKLLYHWSDFYLDTRFRMFTYDTQTYPFYIFLVEHNNGIEFMLRRSWGVKGTTPSLFFSEAFYTIFYQSPLFITPNFTFIPSVVTTLDSYYFNVTNTTVFRSPITKQELNPTIPILMQGGTFANNVFDWSVNDFLDYGSGKNSMLFPFTALFLCIDELNFTSESVVVNAKSEGVINPSSLSIVKTYLIGVDDNNGGDFVVVDDKISQVPLEVNIPSLTTLTVRIFMLKRDNELVPLQIPMNEGFFLQLSIEEPKG